MQNIRPDQPLPRSSHFAMVADGVLRSFLGPMPACQFISEFFPPQPDSPKVPSAFEKGIFDQVVGTQVEQETDMYKPFCSIVRPLIPNLIIRNTSSHGAVDITNYSFSIKPDCTVYSKENKKIYGTSLAAVEFFVEFKFSADSDPFEVSQKSQAPMGLLKDSRSAKETIGQIATYVAMQMDAQYRTHSFFVLIIKDYARLMRWDRSGVVFSEQIYYNTQSELVEFLECYNKAPPEVRGSDGYVGQPTPNEIIAATSTCDSLATSTHLLVVSLQKDIHAEPLRFVIASPSPRPSLPIGRSTRTSVAYDVQKERCVYMKDSWRVVVPNSAVEGEVYGVLNGHNIKNIPRCGLQSSIPIRRHHRLILDTVGKRLDKFSNSQELVRAVRAALIAHKDAYLHGVLHRDISLGNILITDDPAFDGGLLIDWDLCNVRNGTEETSDHRPSRTVCIVIPG
ncbi:hypothetical protein BJV78DRAFT_1137314 [Lactifluus subvellereus]|nr:hypothetical protein BJV78DRAFT_1137314 [Lactifluus subvellereus]